jgi:hypothetical protein
MAASSRAVVFMSGKLYWAKVLGKPVYNKFNDENEWSFEFEPDADGVKILKQHGLTDRLKPKEGPDRKVLLLRKKEFTKDGKPNEPIRIYDGNDEAWEQTKLIGNGSGADVKLDIRDYGVGKKKGIYPAAIRVKDHIAYQSSEFGGMDGEGRQTGSSPKAEAKTDTFKKDFGLDEPHADELDDDLPFE